MVMGVIADTEKRRILFIGPTLHMKSVGGIEVGRVERYWLSCDQVIKVFLENNLKPGCEI